MSPAGSSIEAAPTSDWTIGPVKDDELGVWQTLLQRSFSERWGPLYRRRGFFLDYVRHDPTYRPGKIVGLRVAGQLVSAYQVFKRRMILNDHSYYLDGVGNVGTDVAFQGRGFGSRLMRSYLDRNSSARQMAILFAGDGAFYRKLGWKRLKNYTLSVPKPSIDRESFRREGRWRAVRQEDLPVLGRVYSRFNRAEGISHVSRSGAYWQSWVWDWKLRVYQLSPKAFIDRKGRLVGYMFTRNNGDGAVVVEEFAALPSQREAVYRGLLAAFTGTGGRAALLFSRSVPSLERFLEEAGLAHKLRAGWSETGHTFVFDSSLEPLRHRVGLWHVDHV